MKQIKTLEGLSEAGIYRKAVFCPQSANFWKPKPASFILNLQGLMILNLIRKGMFIYEPKREAKRNYKQVYNFD